MKPFFGFGSGKKMSGDGIVIIDDFLDIEDLEHYVFLRLDHL